MSYIFKNLLIEETSSYKDLINEDNVFCLSVTIQHSYIRGDVLETQCLNPVFPQGISEDVPRESSHVVKYFLGNAAPYVLLLELQSTCDQIKQILLTGFSSTPWTIIEQRSSKFVQFWRLGWTNRKSVVFRVRNVLLWSISSHFVAQWPWMLQDFPRPQFPNPSLTFFIDSTGVSTLVEVTQVIGARAKTRIPIP